MAQDYETDRRTQPPATTEPAVVPPVETGTAASFTSAGPIPPVEAATTPAGPTASDRAFAASGPGVKAVEALFTNGTPPPKKVIDVIDGHRDETKAIFAYLESKAGAAYAAEVHAAMDHLRASVSRREVVAGDPSDPSSGYFIGSQADRGARWRTADGGFTGTVDKEKGLESRYALGAHDALHAHAGMDRSGQLGWEGDAFDAEASKGRSRGGALAWEHDGRNEGELYASSRGGSDYEGGLRRSWEVGGGSLTAGARHRVVDGGATDGLFGSYRTADGRTEVGGAVGVRDGKPAESIGATSALTPHDTVGGSLSHDVTGTTARVAGTHGFEGGSVTGSAMVHRGPDGTTGAIAGMYQDPRTHVDGNVTRNVDSTSLHLGASHVVSPELSVSGHLDHVRPDHGAGQTTAGISERYRSGEVIHGLDVEAGHGAQDYLRGTASIDTALGHNFYGGGFGSFAAERGHQSSAQLGASLTFTPSEKTALTLAGVIDQNGALEARLQLDVFKSRIASVGDLADHKKDALVSLFLSYSKGENRHMLDDRFGAGQAGTNLGGGGSDQVMAGIRIKF